MMKVIMLSRAVFPFHGFGGMQRYVYFLSKHLIKQGVDVEIVTTQIDDKTKYTTFDGINYTFLPPKEVFAGSLVSQMLTPIKYRMFALYSARYLMKRKFDVLHSYGMTPIYYVLLKNRKPMIVQTFGNEPFKVKHKMLRFLYYASFYFPSLLMMKHSDSIASGSEAQIREIMELYYAKKDKIFLLSNAIDIDLIHSYLAQSTLTRKDLGLNDDDFVLINVGRLVPYKGVSYLITALSLINKKINNAKLILVGQGPEEEKIKSLVKKYGLEKKVQHYKNITDSKLFELYNLADVFITPTLFEWLPTVVLEAMACRLPIIASDIPEIRKVVQNNRNGFLFPPGDSNALAKAIMKIHSKDLKPMRAASEKTVKEYDWNVVAKMAKNEYERLLSLNK